MYVRYNLVIDHKKQKKGFLVYINANIDHKKQKKGFLVYINANIDQKRIFMHSLPKIMLQKIVLIQICSQWKLLCWTNFFYILSLTIMVGVHDQLLIRNHGSITHQRRFTFFFHDWVFRVWKTEQIDSNHTHLQSFIFEYFFCERQT